MIDLLMFGACFFLRTEKKYFFTYVRTTGFHVRSCLFIRTIKINYIKMTFFGHLVLT